MRIETKRLFLRDFTSEDFARIHSYAAIPEFSRFEAWGPNSEADTRKFIADRMTESVENPRWRFDLAVCHLESGLLVGGCGLRRDSPESWVGNLGWAIHPDSQNQGFATEAAEALVRFGFMSLGLRLIYATCDAENLASQAVMRKLGLRMAGRINREREQKGKWRDTLRFELLPDRLPSREVSNT